MLGLGTFGNENGGSSASSSNLSALAQPFTVDRPVPKPPSKPLVNFAESTYVAPFNSSLHNWVHPQSSSSRTDYFSNPNSVVDSVQTPSNAYGYAVSQPVNSPVINLPPLSHVVSGVAHLPSVSPISSARTDVFSFGQCSDRNKTSLVEANPYYQTPFVAPSIEDSSPLVVFNEPNYDLLSNSHNGHMNMSSSLDDYTLSMPGLEYPMPWSGFWNGLADDEQGKQVELDGSLSSKESNFVGSSIYRSYVNQGDLTAEGVSNHEEVSVPIHRKYVDILGRDNSVGSLSADHFNNKSFHESQANPMAVPLDFPRTSFSGSTSLLETHHPRAPSLESTTNSWNCRKPLTASYENFCVKIDSCAGDPASKAKSSPAIIIRPPANSASSLGVNTFSLRNLNCTDNSDFSGHHLSKMEEPHIPVISECGELYSDKSKFNGPWQRNVHLSVESFSTRKDELSNNAMGMKDAENLLKARPELQVPHLNVEDCYTFSPKSTEAVLSMDNTSETFDHYNPAVDSPCWKGARTSHFSPFEVSEALSPRNFTGQFKPLDGFNLQGPHSFSLNIDDTIIFSSQKPNENPEYHENISKEHDLLPSQRRRPSVGNHPSKEQKSSNAFGAGSCYPKLSSGDKNQFSADINQQKLDHLQMYGSRSDSNLEPSHTMQKSFEEVKFTSERKLLQGVGVEVTGHNINDGLGHDSSHETDHLTEMVSCSSLSGDNASTKLNKGVLESAPKIDVHVLINTVQDLSVLLLSHCSDDAFFLKEQDHETLKRVIGNLEACLTKKVQQLTGHDSSHFLEELPDLNKSTCASSFFGKRMPETNVEDQFHCQSNQKDRRQYSVSGNEDEKLSTFVSSGAVEDTVNDNTTQAIRKILDKSFHHEEEADPQALLYRNLWLEAEAALCSITYRARFDRMKTKMDKLNLHKTEEKPSSSQVLSDLNMVDKFERESEENPEPDITFKESLIVNTMNHAADVVDRFHILKNRYEQSDSLNTKDVGKQSRSKFSCDMYSDHNVDAEVKVDHSRNISTSSVSDDVMARSLILKCRDDKSNTMPAERQHLSEEEDLEFAGKGNNWMFIKERMEDATSGHDLQVQSSKGKFDSYLDDYNCDIVKEFHEHVTDDPVIQLPSIDGLQNQLPAGFSDGSSSDWEHVLKEDLPGGN